MNYDEIEQLLDKYNWVLESESPLNIKSQDGEHYAQNFAAEVVIEYFMLLDQNGDEDEKQDVADGFKIIEQVKKDI